MAGCHLLTWDHSSLQGQSKIILGMNFLTHCNHTLPLTKKPPAALQTEDCSLNSRTHDPLMESELVQGLAVLTCYCENGHILISDFKGTPTILQQEIALAEPTSLASTPWADPTFARTTAAAPAGHEVKGFALWSWALLLAGSLLVLTALGVAGWQWNSQVAARKHEGKEEWTDHASIRTNEDTFERESLNERSASLHYAQLQHLQQKSKAVQTPDSITVYAVIPLFPDLLPAEVLQKCAAWSHQQSPCFITPPSLSRGTCSPKHRCLLSHSGCLQTGHGLVHKGGRRRQLQFVSLREQESKPNLSRPAANTEVLMKPSSLKLPFTPAALHGAVRGFPPVQAAASGRQCWQGRNRWERAESSRFVIDSMLCLCCWTVLRLLCIGRGIKGLNQQINKKSPPSTPGKPSENQHRSLGLRKRERGIHFRFHLNQRVFVLLPVPSPSCECHQFCGASRTHHSNKSDLALPPAISGNAPFWKEASWQNVHKGALPTCLALLRIAGLPPGAPHCPCTRDGLALGLARPLQQGYKHLLVSIIRQMGNCTCTAPCFMTLPSFSFCPSPTVKTEVEIAPRLGRRRISLPPGPCSAPPPQTMQQRSQPEPVSVLLPVGTPSPSF
ncbi:Cytochrome c biogenesis protein CcsA [Varanus komodoensis]|nr:Cytochrome c biogenesis protein CcsA [Varanus komodoensis]